MIFTERDVLLADALSCAGLNGTPLGIHHWKWMGNILPGDVVVEQSTRHSRPWEARIGVLVCQYDKVYPGYGERCAVLSCKDCNREKWIQQHGRDRWKQVLRT